LTGRIICDYTHTRAKRKIRENIRAPVWITHILPKPESETSPLLDNSSVSTFARQRIEAVTDELFEMVVSIRFASKLQKESSFHFNSV
jgi:hypothetical protein